MAEFAEHLVPLLALTAMEIVLGIDNIVFISILTSKLPAKQRKSGRNIGLGLALGTRLLLLFALAFVIVLIMQCLVNLFSSSLALGYP